MSAASWWGILLLLGGEGKPITSEVEVLNSLFHIICLKAAGAIKTSKRMLRAQPKRREDTRQPGDIFRLIRPDELYPGLLKR